MSFNGMEKNKKYAGKGIEPISSTYDVDVLPLN